MRLISAIIVVLQIGWTMPTRASPIEQPATQIAVRAEDAFAQMRQMVGLWKPADKPQSPLRIRFYLTAGETVLVESWEVRGQPHSLTLYHRDGEALLATHYCPQGNQPRLQLVGRDTSGLHFAFRDVTDLDPATESHQHDLWLDLSDPRNPVRGETYASSAAPGTQESMKLIRVEPGEG